MRGADKHFYTERGGGTNIFSLKKRGGIFHVKDVDDNVDGGWGENVSEANILVSEASKLSAGARIYRGP